MKLFIQIPCLNEEQTLPDVLSGIPTHIDGVDEIEVLVIDDGSSDRTGEVARQLGVRHVLRHRERMGLARSFHDGLDYALAHGADIVVNTDGDNQYPQADIPRLIAPILAGDAEVVIGDRQTRSIAHFSPLKRWLQRVGSWVVSVAARTSLPDAASGFRAYSRAAIYRLNVITDFSYTMDTIIQAGNKGLKIVSVPIVVNARTRESRLFKHPVIHILQSAKAIIRSNVMFRPVPLFAWIAALMFAGALIPFVRYLVLLGVGGAGQHIQSLIVGVALLVGALLAVALAFIADLLRTNRILVEDALERLKRLQHPPDGDV